MGTEKLGSWDGERSGIVNRSHGFAVRSLNAETRSVEVIASSESLDSHDEIVEQTWDFKRYAKNPVILWAHNRAPGYDGRPIGRGENIRVEQTAEGPQLKMGIVFASAEANPFADSIFKLFQEGMLRSVSVGFRPKDVRLETRGGEDVFVLADNELYELSVVPIGSNPDAIALSADPAVIRMKDAARAAAHPQIQPAMSAERTSTKMSEADTEMKALRTSLDESRAEKTVADGRVKELEKSLTESQAELATVKTRAEKSEKKLIEGEVEALVGKKITPAQRDKFIKLRSTQGEKEFAEFVAEMPELPTLKAIVGDDTDTTNTVGKTKGVPSKMAALFNKAEG